MAPITFTHEIDWDAAVAFLLPTVMVAILQLWAILDSSTHPVTTTGSTELSASILALAQLAGQMQPEWPYPRDRFSQDLFLQLRSWGETSLYTDYTQVYVSSYTAERGRFGSFTGDTDIGYSTSCAVDLEASVAKGTLDAATVTEAKGPEGYYDYFAPIRDCTPVRPLQVMMSRSACSEPCCAHSAHILTVLTSDAVGV